MQDNEREQYKLKQLQCLPLDCKINLTRRRVREYYEHYQGQVYVAFSGGKDSTVLLHIVREMYPEVSAVFFDTGLEYPEIRDFVKTFQNVEWIKPNMTFTEVLKKYGYPAISKEQAQFIYQVRHSKFEEVRHKRIYGREGYLKNFGIVSQKWYRILHSEVKISAKCCSVMKKNPAHKYNKRTGRFPIIGTMADESMIRKRAYEKRGCNSFDGKSPRSAPLSVWVEADIWEYIRTYDIPYSKIYDMGYRRTGCMFCMFGVQMEKGENRFQKMAKTHPKQYKYCIEQLGCGRVLDLMGVNYKPIKSLFNEGEENAD